MIKYTLATLLAIAVIIPTTAQRKKKKKKDKTKTETKWDVANPGVAFNYKNHSFIPEDKPHSYVLEFLLRCNPVFRQTAQRFPLLLMLEVVIISG